MFFKHLKYFSLLGIFLACSSTEMTKVSKTELESKKSEIEKMKDDLIKSNVDLLAKDQFKDGLSNYEEGLEEMREDEDFHEAMEEFVQASKHFEKAKEIARSKNPQIGQILNSRQRAIANNPFQTKDLHKELKNIDEDLIDETDNFQEELPVDEYATFQDRYLKLETHAVQQNHLGAFRDIIYKAGRENAARIAKDTYNAALKDLRIAENMISQSPRDASVYQESVEETNKSAKLLKDVMDKLNGEAQGSSEAVALKLVHQERKLGKLSATVENLETNLNQTEDQLGMVSSSLKEKEIQFQTAHNKVAIQEAMDKVRTEIDSDKAEVYQQGNQLIFRLKKINFPVNSAKVPTESFDLLAKINTIIKDLNPKNVMVQGHTDSTGDDKYNLSLSEKRADSVKSYLAELQGNYELKAKGFGEEQPIANNETSKGRSQNRRVDLIVETASFSQFSE